jgi:hypothetical protein
MRADRKILISFLKSADQFDPFEMSFMDEMGHFSNFFIKIRLKIIWMRTLTSIAAPIAASRVGNRWRQNGVEFDF